MDNDLFRFRRQLYETRAPGVEVEKNPNLRTSRRVERHEANHFPKKGSAEWFQPQGRGRSRGRSQSRQPSHTSSRASSRQSSRGSSRSQSRSGRSPKRPSNAGFRQQEVFFQQPVPPRPDLNVFIQHAAGEGRGRATSARRTNRSVSRPRLASTSPGRAMPTEPRGTPASLGTPTSRGTRVFSITPAKQQGPESLQTVVCSRFRDGLCSFGAQCTFAHPGFGANIVVAQASSSKAHNSRKHNKKETRRQIDQAQADVERVEEEKRTALLQAFEASLNSSQVPEAEAQQAEVPQPMAPALLQPMAPPPADLPATSYSTGEDAIEASSDFSSRLRFSEPEVIGDQDPRSGRAPAASTAADRRILSVFDKEPWTVLLSDSAFSTLQRLSSKQQELALRSLKSLATGRWSEDQKKEVATHEKYKLRQACFDLSYSILWGIDMEFQQERDAFIEVIQIWDVCSGDSYEKARDGILHEWRQSRRNFDGVLKALKGQKLKNTEVRLPRVVPRTELQDGDVFSVRKFFALDAQMLHSLLFEEDEGRRSTSASEQLRLRISKQEAEVLGKPGPMIVIGRSGAGKTLCCVYRMWAQYQAYWKKAIDAGGAPLLPGEQINSLVHINQVFVTHSASLANKVLEYFNSMQHAESRGQRSSQLVEQSRLPHDIRKIKVFPLFITFRKWLIMLDGCQTQAFFPRRYNGDLHHDRVDLAESPDGLDPLSTLREQRRAAQRAQNLGANHRGQQVLTEVDFDLFEKRFWPKVRVHCPSGCDASLVWREIQSYIKGHHRVLDATKGHLELTDYCEVAKKCSPSFEAYRSQIYQAFETYEALRKEWNCFDRLDACLHVVRQLQATPYSGPPVHCVAVDEVQDLAQLELALFFLVMRKPYEDLFITGDTSQTVSRSVDFRFCDLRSIFHHFKVSPPEIDQLIINYRSHQKLLALSHRGVVRVLELAFPYAVDVLQPDLGHKDGPKPIVVTDVPVGALGRHLFDLSGSGGGIAFGASQCILVRSEEAKLALPAELQSALVLTVEQSKGLEFDDVILVNFFSNSSYHEWQILRNFRDDLVEADGTPSDKQKKKPHFEKYRHTLLCSELKHLYVAMTRTKHVLLFVEEDTKQAQYAFDLWGAMDLVNFGLLTEENKEALDQLISRAGGSRGRESWRSTGLNLLRSQLFEQAQSCFARAEEWSLQKICEAYILARRAAQEYADAEARGTELYLQAAELFHQAGGAEREQAECLLQGGRANEAAQVFLTAGLEADAARALDHAGEYIAASRLYEKVGQYHDALESLMRAENVAEVKRVVLIAHERGAAKAEECFRYLQDIESHDVAGDIYQREGEWERAANCFQSAGLLGKQAECYERMGQMAKAAELMSTSDSLADLRRAAELYVNLGQHVKAAECYQNLLQAKEIVEDRVQLLRFCVEVMEVEGDWLSAAELYEMLNTEDSLDRAIESYERAGKPADAARVCQRRVGLQRGLLSFMSSYSAKQRDTLQRAAQLYETANCLQDATQVWEEISNWEQCARLACKQEDYSGAAGYYRKIPAPDKEAGCLILAKEWQAAYTVLSRLIPSILITEQKMECLIAMHEYAKAARLQMEILPDPEDENTRERRNNLVLKAFGLAKKDPQAPFKNFLNEFRHEMPDDVATLMYFVELAAPCEMAEQLVKLKKPFAAAGAASVCGDPVTGLEQLKALANEESAGGDDRDETESDDGTGTPNLDEAMLDMLHVASQCILSKELATAVLPYCAWIHKRNRLKKGRDLILHLAEARFQRFAKVIGPRTTKWLKEAVPKIKDRHLLFCIYEELAHSRDGHMGWIKKALESLHEIRGNVRSTAPKAMLDVIYCAQPELHMSLFKALDGYRANQLDGRALSIGHVIPTGHALGQSGVEQIKAFPAVARIKHAGNNVMEDLWNREEQLLKRMANMKGDEAVLDAPEYWLWAFEEAKEHERKASLEKGFIRAVVKACEKSSWKPSPEVKQHLHWCAETIWDSAREGARQMLMGDSGSKFKTDELERVMLDVLRICRIDHMAQNGKVDDKALVKKLQKLVLKDLKQLLPVCPYQVLCKKCPHERCRAEHPDVPVDTDPWVLLNCAETVNRGNMNAQYSELCGVGLPGWIDLTTLCRHNFEGKCNRKNCPRPHTTEQETSAVNREFGGEIRGTGKYFYNKVAKALMTTDGALMPRGFGCIFVKRPEMAEYVRLIAVLARTLANEKLSFASIMDVLVCMCEAAYRYPDKEAVTIVKQVLRNQRPEDLDKISAQVTWSVVRSKDHNLLESVVDRPRLQAAAKSVAQRPSNLRAEAPTFQPGRVWAAGQRASPGQPAPNILARPEISRWTEGGNAAERLDWRVAGTQGSSWYPTVPQTRPPGAFPPAVS